MSLVRGDAAEPSARERAHIEALIYGECAAQNRAQNRRSADQHAILISAPLHQIHCFLGHLFRAHCVLRASSYLNGPANNLAAALLLIAIGS